MENGRLEKEADVFATYLLGRPPDSRVRALYRSAIEKIAALPEGKDARLLELAVKYPALIGFIDAGTAIVRRDCVFRRRLLAMFAIVECSPSNSDLFLPTARNRLYSAWILWAGTRAVLKAILGAIVVGLA